MQVIDLGKRKIGLGYPAYIVAEIGINHNGDMDLAQKTILAAKEAGADAVKFQNYKTEDFVPTKNLEYEYISQGKKTKEFQHDMFKRYELSDEQICQLKEFCDRNQIDFHSTPTNNQGVDLLKKIGVNVLKNGSDYLTNLDLISHMGKTGLPTVLSTGMALIGEIDDAVNAFRETGNQDLILLHCTSQYPTPAEDIHLRKIETLRNTFGAITGFSDHSEGAWAAIGSVVFETAWVEKHFTLDKTLPGPDHRFSSDACELAILVEGVRFMEKALGSSQLGPTEPELEMRMSSRLSCCAKNDISKGHVLTEQDLAYFRPGIGLPPKARGYFIGRTTTTDLRAGEVIELVKLA
jgi:N-acetylneuraminate synthase/N,N'-diacetyllegionaminate synthase